MNSEFDPKLRGMPTEGLREYIYWADIYTEIRQTSIKILDILKRLQIQDPDNDYSDQMAEAFAKAFLNDMNWEIRRRSILASWLRDGHGRYRGTHSDIFGKLLF